jgi:four helix bundle protein
LASIKTFEDIEAGQEARRLARLVYRTVENSTLRSDFGLRDQLQRASVSVMANIAEGFGRYRNTEFIQYLRVSSGSCAEVQSNLYIGLDAGLISQEQFDSLQSQSKLVAKKLSAFRRYLANLTNQTNRTNQTR